MFEFLRRIQFKYPCANLELPSIHFKFHWRWEPLECFDRAYFCTQRQVSEFRALEYVITEGGAFMLGLDGALKRALETRVLAQNLAGASSWCRYHL